ncbi:beta-phosphoglucomutase [Bacillus sp. 2205SS5-2]|uniref:beta-phosphoglucomutase n=1 Tax=Bacillus sp. 2205SS5-2 TaxID=3109031 RepID=UPI003005C8E1
MEKLVQAFIFDLDGVITDTAEYHFLAWQALANDVNITFTREHNEELKGISRMESLEKILLLGNREHDFTDDEKQGLAAKKNDHYLTLIKEIAPSDILPGMKEFILEIKEKGLKLGLASASKNAITVMEALGLKDEFDVIVDSNKIAKGKPNPEIFLTAAELLQVDPRVCIGVEDAVAGVEAIKGASMFAVAIGPKESFKKADLVYASTGAVSLTEILSVYAS